jgi:uncharacterized protein (TIGR00255 family)
MTGFGDARSQDPQRSIEVEIRSVNNRHFKLSTRISEPYNSLETELEHQIRERVRRGAVQVSIRVERPPQSDDYRLNLVALKSYRDQLLAAEWIESGYLDLSALLTLPGVVEGFRPSATDPLADWPAISRAVGAALDCLEAARLQEGKAMACELQSLGQMVESYLGRIAERGPHVVQSYEKRLLERVQALVQDRDVTVDTKDLIREVAILSDRSDISEEIIRLRAHLAQFRELLQESESAGRKLEFVVQEMGREVNTIGSKANDVEISRNVVEIKGVLEKIRELIQNVE